VSAFLIADPAISAIMEGVMEEFEDTLLAMTDVQILGLVMARAQSEGIHMEVSSTGGGVLMERVTLH
jgi:hypothetical protein